MMVLTAFMALWPLIRNLSRRARARARNASLIDLLASPQVKTLDRVTCVYRYILVASKVVIVSGQHFIG